MDGGSHTKWGTVFKIAALNPSTNYALANYALTVISQATIFTPLSAGQYNIFEYDKF